MHGVKHWWHQRLSAISTLILMTWLLYIIYSLANADIELIATTISAPFHRLAFILFIFSTFYHSSLGMQIIIEDYVSSIFTRNMLIVLMQIFCILTVTGLIIALFYIN